MEKITNKLINNTGLQAMAKLFGAVSSAYRMFAVCLHRKVQPVKNRNERTVMETTINELIQKTKCETNRISDGYHTFGELYEHRITLFIALCRLLKSQYMLQVDNKGVWRSKLHSDGTALNGWFVLGIFTVSGSQITYHLPIEKWEETNFAATLEKAPEFDGHTSEDVLKRLKYL